MAKKEKQVKVQKINFFRSRLPWKNMMLCCNGALVTDILISFNALLIRQHIPYKVVFHALIDLQTITFPSSKKKNISFVNTKTSFDDIFTFS